MERSNFEEWWEENENEETGDQDNRIHDMCKMAWNYQQESLSPKVPDRFVTSEEAQVLAMDLARRYLMLCGCSNLAQTQRAAVKLLGVAQDLVEQTDESKAVRLVDSSGKNIID